MAPGGVDGVRGAPGLQLRGGSLDRRSLLGGFAASASVVLAPGAAHAIAGFGGREAKVKGIKYNKVNYAADNGIVATSGLGSDEATGVANKQKWVGDYKQNKGSAELSVYVSGDKVTMVGIDGPGAKQWSASTMLRYHEAALFCAAARPNGSPAPPLQSGYPYRLVGAYGTWRRAVTRAGAA